jgi:ComF family protein
MIDSLFSTIAPHLCCGCGKIGTLLCDYCKYNISSEAHFECIICGNKNYNSDLCEKCHQIIEHAWCVGQRTDVLRKLIDDYKFERVKSAHKTLAELLHAHIGQLPASTVVVSVPTVASHIRQRGYDHAALLAQTFARLQGLRYRPVLKRRTTTAQRDASRSTRIQQARLAFTASAALSPNQPYLLIDDIITTGSTITYGVKALQAAGAGRVWVAAVARQPLD